MVPYLIDNDSLLTTYNLSHTVNLIQVPQSSSTHPIIDGLSDHGAKYLTVNNAVPGTNTVPLKQRTKEVNNKRIM